MRMYLSSFRVGDQVGELTALLGDDAAGCPVAVVANALDALSPGARREGVEREMDALAELGMRPVELDLRTYFGRPETAVAHALDGVRMVWVRGGNAFVLRYALSLSRADAVLTRMVGADSLVYAGYSAGVCVLAPDLGGLESCDDPREVGVAYGASARPVVKGMGVLPYAVVPHVDSPEHPESEVLSRVADRYAEEGVPHRTLKDGEVLLVDGEHARIC